MKQVRVIVVLAAVFLMDNHLKAATVLGNSDDKELAGMQCYFGECLSLSPNVNPVPGSIAPGAIARHRTLLGGDSGRKGSGGYSHGGNGACPEKSQPPSQKNESSFWDTMGGKMIRDTGLGAGIAVGALELMALAALLAGGPVTGATFAVVGIIAALLGGFLGLVTGAIVRTWPGLRYDNPLRYNPVHY